MNINLKLLTVSLCFVFIAAGCNSANSGQKNENEKLQVVATYSIVYDIVKNVGGDLVEARSLAPIGSNPHEYDPLPADVQKTADADIVFYNGLNLESGNSWFEKLLETTGKSGADAPVFKISEGVQIKYLTSAGNEGEADPHAWLNIQNGILYAKNARDAFIQIDPENAEIYQSNAEEYIEQLEQLHTTAIERISEIPENQRYLITSEGAFKYFSEAYGIEAGYIWEINSEEEGTSTQIKDVIELIRSKEIKVLFLETSIDARSMEMVSNETNIPIGGKVFTDSIASPGEPGDSYIGMMEWNINTIIEQIQLHQ